jgi:hypothetical protein
MGSEVQRLIMKIEYYQKYKELKKENHIFTYTGSLGFKDVILLKELIEKILLAQSAESKQKRKVMNILIEALQNIYLHGETHANNHDHPGQDCMLFLGKEAHSYFVVFGNFIKNRALPLLEQKLEQLTEMDIPTLRGLYLRTLDKGEITNKGGASLGLVKMFIDSGKNSFYKFDPVDEEYSFFSIELKVPDMESIKNTI